MNIDTTAINEMLTKTNSNITELNSSIDNINNQINQIIEKTKYFETYNNKICTESKNCIEIPFPHVRIEQYKIFKINTLSDVLNYCNNVQNNIEELKSLLNSLKAITETGIQESIDIENKYNQMLNIMDTNNKDKKEIEFKTTKVADAKTKYKNELAIAKKTTITEHTFMTITDKNINGSNYTITHIVVDDPSQIMNIQSNDSYATGGESIYSMRNRTNGFVVGVTGGFFLEGTGCQNLQGANHVVIQNGKLVATNAGLVTDSNYNSALNTEAGNHLICLDKNGKIFNAPTGATAKDLIENYNVRDTFVSHETPRLNNGELQHVNDDGTFQDGFEWNKSYNRTYLCMTEPGEYYFIQGIGTPANAITYAKNELGCTFAGSLEQGGAVALVTKDEDLINHSGYSTIGNAFAIVDKESS